MVGNNRIDTGQRNYRDTRYRIEVDETKDGEILDARACRNVVCALVVQCAASIRARVQSTYY